MERLFTLGYSGSKLLSTYSLTPYYFGSVNSAPPRANLVCISRLVPVFLLSSNIALWNIPKMENANNTPDARAEQHQSQQSSQEPLAEGQDNQNNNPQPVAGQQQVPVVILGGIQCKQIILMPSLPTNVRADHCIRYSEYIARLDQRVLDTRRYSKSQYQGWYVS
jgi:hypothetical protein